VDKQILIDAIKGRGISDMQMCIEFEKVGLMEFTGNQHNPQWSFLDSKLQDTPLEELERIYSICKGE